ncbi:MAG: Tail Collar domain protein [Holophagaceae bacterium]|nr:Tail Collar domain protein [Holophagaceae bacterium]
MRRSLLPSLAAVLVSQIPFVAMATEALPNPQIAYQGRLLEGTLPVTGSRTFVFAILDSGGAELWNSGDQVLSVTNGLYAVVLGGTGMTAIPTEVLAKPNLKLRVAIGGTTLTPDTDLVPALQARSAFELTGSFAGDLGGTQYKTTLQSLQGFPLDLTTANPTSGQSLVFDGTSWVPSTVTGVQGATGPQGPAGPTGPTGAQGIQGIQGIQGATGPLGATGSTGAAGRSVLNGSGAPNAGLGVDGDFYLDTAASTIYGPKGSVMAGQWPAVGVSLIGLQGATGATGAAGATGAVGPLGPQGIQGVTGATGSQGPTGPQGATGAQGPQGDIGLPGPVGPQGAQGVTGPTGAQGATGATGAPVSFKGTWSSSTDYVIGDTVYENGTSYIALVGNQNVDPATDVAGGATSWAVLALQGATGPSGGVSVVTADAPLSVTNGSTSPKIALTGTLPDAVFPATLPALSGVNVTGLNASNLSRGTLPDAVFPATLPALSGVNVTSLNASNLHSGTLPTARMPALTGDISSSSGSTSATVTKLQGVAVAATAPTSGQVLAYNGAAWTPTATPGGTVTSITAGAGLSGGTITNSGTISIPAGGVTNALIQAPYINVTATANSGLSFSGGSPAYLGGTVTLSDSRFGTNTSWAASGRSGAERTIGEVWLVAGTVAGGLPCQGQTLQISQHSALYSLLGTYYGGDGMTTFNLPDLRKAAPSGLTYVICIEGIFPTRD